MEQAASAGTDHGAEHKPRYMAVFFGLFVLTAVEVGVSYLGFGDTLMILILVGLALWKAALVALYYMHLRYEPPRLILMVLAPLPLALILVLAVITQF